MTDAAHMLSDLSGMVVSLLALRLSRQRATLRYTYGYHQAEVLGALGSVVIVWFMTGGLLVCAYDRFLSVQNVNAKLMLATAIFGLITNVMLMVTLGHDHGHGHGGHDDHGHGHSHGHGHGHGHDSARSHKEDHGHGHGKGHGHGESHGRGHDHDCEHDHGHDEEHGHGHGKSHGHGESHGHGHDHDSDHDEEHGHGHGHKKGHDHDCEHDHGHENDHGKDHGHGEGRGHDHDCEHDHGHGESHGDGHDRDHDSEHEAHPGSGGRSLLLDAAYVHALGDLLQNVGVLLAAALIYFKPWDIGETDGVSNWMYADPFCTVLFSVLVLWSTVSPLRRSVVTIMQECPAHVDVEEYERKLLAVDHVVDVQDLHVWSVGSNKTLGTAHLLIDASDNSVGVLNECVRISRATEIYHTTFQLNVRGLFDHSIFSDWGGIHGHERCCGVPVPISPSKSSNHSNEKDHGHGHRDEKDHGHGHGDLEHGHGHGHGHGRAH